MQRDGGSKRFSSNPGSGDKMEYLFTAALAIIIVGALALTIYYAVFKSGGGASGMPTLHYECDKCQARFEISHASRPDLFRAESAKIRRIDCRKCQGKNTAWLMTQCPACNKYYVRPSDRQQTDKPDVCPFCKADFNDALYAKLKNLQHPH